VNDRSLTEAEIATLVSWADNGAPEGKAEDAPPPVAWVDGWQIGKPDVILEMQSEFQVPASGTIEYQHYIIPTNFTEDVWVQAVEARPGNRAVLHHAVVFIRPANSKWLREFGPGGPYVPNRDWRVGVTPHEEILDTYVPGAIPHKMPAGRAKLIPKGSDLVFQMHYTANGKAATDRSRIGLIVAKEPPKERQFSMSVTNSRFLIPAGAPAHPVEARMILQHDTTIIGMSPHMHLRGRSMEYRAVFPDGRTQILLNVPRYDFNWQLFYYLTDEVTAPKGTRLEVSATFDNSPNNPSNPDPKAEVRWGDQSWQEMMVGFVDVVIDPKLDPISLYRGPRRAGSGGE
jgi:hypothetical protein